VHRRQIDATRNFAQDLRVSSVNGRIMLAGSAPNGSIVDQAMTIAKQFGADVINSVKVSAPQQVMLEVRFVEAQRNASRELGVNWQVVQTNLLNGGAGIAAIGLFMVEAKKVFQYGQVLKYATRFAKSIGIATLHTSVLNESIENAMTNFADTPLFDWPDC